MLGKVQHNTCYTKNSREYSQSDKLSMTKTPKLTLNFVVKD